ncbi:diguanylate cyclase (GGDEF) domain-containing protein [Paenibacillus algorifonticola]|uniref:Diguanylate cyclase (GGDEF) domain-containing protein n=1 Tax=Paenibacillus algorifonticola TaxID=684063 RepID=A0A1I2D9X6_9BACL|nr:sensor domain-containing diguanylate cyclase [Paenibacillus algorifonticola]SFE77278.1 diguanylate cyclase (GGDEF) domain-containing protein [Paenibacillus algorifonticola]
MYSVLKRKKGFTLASIISCIVLFSVLITIVINVIIAFKSQRESLYNNTLELNRITAGDLSKTTQSLVISMKRSLEITATYLSDADLESSAVLAQLDFFMGTNHYFNSIAVVNAKGVIVSTSPNNLGVIGRKVSTEEATQALKLQKPHISKPYISPSNRMIVFVSQPVFSREGAYRGYVAGTIYLQHENIFREILGVQNENNSGSYFYVVDEEGNMIYHPHMEDHPKNVSMNAAVQQLMQGKSGQQQVTNSQGVDFLAGYSVVPETQWGIVSQTPVSYIEQQSWELITDMLKVSAPFVLLLLFLTLWLSRMLASPLNRLANYAAQLTMMDQMPDTLPSQVHWNYEANQLNATVALAFHEMKRKNDELFQESQTDALTGLPNRRTLKLVTEDLDRRQIPFSVIMLDLDHFKSVNDEFGHPKGDEVLRLLAAMMLEHKREGDFCFRYGGEEFTIVLPYTSEEDAFGVAEQLRKQMGQADTPIGRQVTLSLGIASHSNQLSEIDDLFKQADDALYAAKHNGRNQTILHSQLSEQSA